jgi:hypothetical protein
VSRQAGRAPAPGSRAGSSPPSTRWENLQAAGTPYDLQRATFYNIDANAVTYVNLSAFSGAES